jgi:hypothetical protein
MSIRRSLAAFVALALAVPASNPSDVQASFRGESVNAGGAAALWIAPSSGLPKGCVAYVVFGDAEGRTDVRVGDRIASVPVSGKTWTAGAYELSQGAGHFSGAIPSDPSLVGRRLSAALVVVAPDGSFFVSARIGGPIIQDILA